MKTKRQFPIRSKLTLLVLVAMLPILALSIYLIISFLNYSRAYDSIVSNMTIANSYNLDFKEQMDESLYKLAVSNVTFDTIGQDDSLRNPYDVIKELKSEFTKLMDITTDRESRAYLQTLLRNIDTLENRVDDLRRNINNGGKYEKNMEMLDNNIYILTELIQDDIQNYIYYQTKSMESLRNQLTGEVTKFIIISSITVGLIFIIVVIITLTLVKNITTPIQELKAATGLIAEGDFTVHTEVETDDELSDLSKSINDMAEKLEVMVDKIKEDERKMRHAELRLLQEQINPHFLYNTLDTIVWLIEGNDPEKAVNMVVSLSEFFRLVLSKGKEFISLQDEEMHIKSYLEIQQFRYRDILDYEINIDKELYPYRILKLTLQPLVENALYHGIKYKRAKGMIYVTGKFNDAGNIELKVKDTGVGIDEDTLEKIRDEISKPCKETNSGFGLANVNERIRMNFGQEYGMVIESVEGEGTEITIEIPAVYL